MINPGNRSWILLIIIVIIDSTSTKPTIQTETVNNLFEYTMIQLIASVVAVRICLCIQLFYYSKIYRSTCNNSDCQVAL